MFKYPVIFIVCITLAGCGKSITDAPVQPKSGIILEAKGDSKGLLGLWILKSIEAKSPETFDFKSYQAEFLLDGSWKYEAKMAGKLAGMHLKGSGTWKIKDGMLVYTAGKNGQIKGTTQLVIHDRQLTLAPDPVVRPGGSTRVTTIYSRP